MCANDVLFIAHPVITHVTYSTTTYSGTRTGCCVFVNSILSRDILITVLNYDWMGLRHRPPNKTRRSFVEHTLWQPLIDLWICHHIVSVVARRLQWWLIFHLSDVHVTLSPLLVSVRQLQLQRISWYSSYGPVIASGSAAISCVGCGVLVEGSYDRAIEKWEAHMIRDDE